VALAVQLVAVAFKDQVQCFQLLPRLGAVVVLRPVLVLEALVVLAAVELLAVRLEALVIHHQQVHHKVTLAALAVVLAANMVLEAAAARLLLALMEQPQ
jgi:hypothetical protein